MYKFFLKRVLDLITALVLLPILMLVILIVAPLIILSDKGPVFYNAYRLGKNGKRFKMFKLRTMSVNAPDIRNVDGSTFNSESDTRVTKIGKIIRKSSIDEFPQLINVIIGEMSFVGPRPNLYSNNYDDFNLIERKRLEVRPGITGFTQAYYRNSISQEEKYIYDAYYVDNISFLFDLKILIKTVITVFSQKNLYSNNL